MKVAISSKKKSSRYARVIGLHILAQQSEGNSASTEYKRYKDPSNSKSAQYAVGIHSLSSSKEAKESQMDPISTPWLDKYSKTLH